MSTPVRRLTITHPRLSDPVTIPLNWESFPEPLQQELDRLDTNDDGNLTYSPARGGAPAGGPFEVQHTDDTANQLSRLFVSFGESFPSNTRRGDLATLDDRTRVLRSIQNGLYDHVVLPVLGGPSDQNDLSRWIEASRLLEETGDYRHLYRFAQMARSQYEATRNIEFLRVAEGALLASRRFASMSRLGRSGTLPDVDRELQAINPILDRADQEAFQRDIQAPYLLATIGSPITADLATLQGEDGMVYFGVAVPRTFVRENHLDPNAVIARFFNETSPVTIRASAFRDQPGTQEFQLTATAVERDAPGPLDDRIDSQSSFHIDQRRLGQRVFGGQEMVYYRVGFRLPEAAEALGDRPIQRFDITLTCDENVRRISGGFVLQNMTGRASRDLFAADIHINERDYEVVQVMTESLARASTQPGADPALRGQIEEVERFYESMNEQVTAAVDAWNDAYRRGEIDRVFLNGDLADFVNIATTLQHQDYRSTNIRRFREIIGRLEAPLYVVSGNHDHHGQPFPLSLHIRNFINAEGLRDLYADHYDSHRFTGTLYFEGIKALLPDSSTDEEWIGDVFRELYADNPFSPPNDVFLDHHLREIGIYETYGVSLGNGFRVFAWPTETEHFNYGRYLLEEAHEPVGLNALKAIPLYVLNQHVNGKGPRPENFIAFLRELETARARGQRLILMGHYPPFFQGEGPDQTPDSRDTLRGEAALAIRLASWYYRNADGESIVAASLGGHVHHYAETDFILHFEDEGERSRFRTSLGQIFARRDPETIFHDIHEIRHAWDLDSRTEIRRVQEPGSDGFPGPIMRSCNENSCSYYRARGTAYLNLPTLGVPSEDQAGYVIITSHPDGRIDVAPRFIRMSLQGSLIDVPGSDLESFRRRRWEEARNWDASHQVPEFTARTEPTAVTISGPHTPGERPRWDFLPIVYQYPENKLALTFDAGWALDFRSGGNGFSLGGQLLLPISRESNLIFGGPNYVALGAEYSWLTRDLNLRGGLDLGLLTPYFTLNAATSERPILGGEILLHSIFPHAGITVFGGSSIDREDWNVGLGLRFTLPVITFRATQPPARPDE